MTENSHQSGDLAQRKVRLGDLLVQTGLISEAQLQLALQEQKRTGSKLGRTVIDLGFVAEVKLLTALSEQLKIPFIELKHFKFDQNLVQTLPEAMARRFRAIPLSREGGGVLVGMSDPLDLFAQDEMERLLKTRVHPAVVREAELLATLDLVYRRTSEIASIAGELEGELQDSDFDLSKLGADNVSDAPVVRLLQTLFEDAVQMKASDIHIEPDEGVVRIRQRIDGVLNEQVMKEQRIASALVMRLKIMSGLDISEKRLPQDGRFNIRVKNRNIDVRVSTMPVQFGESVVMRLLDQSAGIASLDAGGMPADMLARFRRLLQRPYGMVLVTGPTGSGKTTTLYTTLKQLATEEVNVCTIEDPIEMIETSFNQMQVQHNIDLTFASGVRALMRQDPDIIMVGEIRDLETAEMAIQAALTGHLVLSTLHTNDAPSAVTRLLDLGLPEAALRAELDELAALKLALVGLGGCDELYPAELSGGMRKRAALARALALDPQVLFFDEPSAGLDPISSMALDELILQLRDSLGSSIVLVTHELPSIFAVADTCLFLDGQAGTQLALGPPDELLAHGPEAVRRFLGRSRHPAKEAP